MAPVYKIYKVCLQYGTKNGTPTKAAEAKRYQGVSRCDTCANEKRTLAREPGVQDVRDRFRQLTARRRLFGPNSGRSIPSPPVVTPPAEDNAPTTDVPAVSPSPTPYPPLRSQPSRQQIPPRGKSLLASTRVSISPAPEDALQTPSPLDPDTPPADLDTSMVQGESSTAPGTGQSPPGQKKITSKRSKGRLKPEEYEIAFEELIGDDSTKVRMTQKESQTRVP
jgi:hypothetical protein